MKLAFIGGGNMAQALLAGLKNQQFTMSEITVIELDISKHASLQAQFGVDTTSDLADVIAVDTIVLAVKPQQLPALAQSLVTRLRHQLVISIAAGVRLQHLSAWLNQYPTIVRTMPNTPSQIQEGITGLFAGSAVSKAQMAVAEQIMRAAGSTVWVDSEEKLDAVTAISGSGPAYVFYLIEALQAAAQSLNLTEAEAKQLSIATFKGASLLADTSETPVAQLRAQVTSKGGTTEQGLRSLEESKVKEAIMLAAKKTYARAKTLGDELGQTASADKNTP